MEASGQKCPYKGDDRLKKGLRLLTLTLTLMLVTSQIAFATVTDNNGINSDRASGPHPNRVPLAEKLNLSDRQVQQLKEINLSTYQATKALKVKMMDAKFELRQLSIAGTDKSAIDAKIKEIKELKAQIHKIEQEKWQKIQTVLTPEQQSKLKSMKGFGHHSGRYKEGCQ